MVLTNIDNNIYSEIKQIVESDRIKYPSIHFLVNNLLQRALEEMKK